MKRILLIIPFCLLVACDDAEPLDSQPADPGNPLCADLASTCIKMQQGCVVDEAGAAECSRCEFGTHPIAPYAGCVPIQGTPLRHEFAPWDLEAGEEIPSICQSWMLNNEEEIWVNTVEFENTGSYHHSNWFFVPQDYNDWPTEPWVDCYGEGFHEVEAALAGGVLFAQTTQVRQELQKFPDGVAVRIPPHSRIITVTHLLNWNPEPVTTEMNLSFYTLTPEEVEVPLTPFQLIYTPLDIPAQATSTFETRCNVREAYEDLFKDEDFDMDLYYLLPHYHTLATGFEVGIVGGERDGEVLLHTGPLGEEATGQVFDPPIPLSDSDGLSMKCSYHNLTDDTVEWGIGDQEMCELLGFARIKMAFTAGPSDNEIVGEEEGVVVNEGSCDVTGFAFSQTKEGGSPPGE